MADKLASALTTLATGDIDGSADYFVAHDSTASELKKYLANNILQRLLTTDTIAALSDWSDVSDIDLANDDILVFDATAGAFKKLNFREVVGGATVYDIRQYGAQPGTGTDYSTEIQAAYTAAQTDGGEAVIYWPPGIWRHDSTLTLADADRITIWGPGATSYQPAASSTAYAMEFETCDDLSIFGLKFDRANSDNSGSSQDALSVDGCAGVEIAFCEFADCFRGIVLNDDDDTASIACSNVRIHNNVMKAGGTVSLANYQNETCAAFLVVSFNTTPILEDVSILNNHCIGAGVCYIGNADTISVSGNICSGSADSGIYIDNDVNTATVVGNTVTDCGKDSIKLFQCAGGNSVIVGNTCQGAGQIATDSCTHIVVDDCDGVTVMGNTITYTATSAFTTQTNAQVGIFVSASNGVTVNNNTIDGTANTATDDANGISFRTTGAGTAGSMGALKCQGNTLRAINGHGIICVANSTYEISDLDISGNTIETRESGFINGIEILASNTATYVDVKVRNNDISDYATQGIYVGGASGSFTNLEIIDNTFHDPDAAGDDCIGIYNSDYSGGINRLERNRSDGGNTTFFYFQTASDRQLFRTNENYNGSVKEDGWSAAPTGGTWSAGERIMLDAPSAGGSIGYVCTASGSPGTWKTFGSIAT